MNESDEVCCHITAGKCTVCLRVEELEAENGLLVERVLTLEAHLRSLGALPMARNPWKADA